MVFTTPAPLSLPNRAGYAAGTTMDLWSINPTTGFFDNVGVGKVTADGSTIETISGGIRNSSWHFFAPPAPAPKDPSQDPRNPKDKCNECKAKGGLTSEVEMHSGAVIETHNLVSYQSMGESRSLTLTYDSLRADPRPIVHFGYNNAPADTAQKLVAKLTVDTGKFKYQIPGYSGNQYSLTGGEHFWSMPNNGGTIDAALQVDMSALPSGQYDYTINSGIRRFTGTIFAGSSTDTKDKLISVNTINSPFGSGWGIAGWQELVENADSSVLLIDGDGSELVFDKSTLAGSGYVSPPGDFSKFEKLTDGTFRRTLKDQTVYSFNTGKRLVSVKEANGNETKYIYNSSGELSQIIDVAGLITKFTYANGKVSQIEDPAGRLTKLEYDGVGNLLHIVDPDTKARTFSYDTQRHITKEIDKRGFSEQTSYDFAGRATGGIRKDGSQLQVAPVQVQGLYRQQDTTNPLNAPVAKPLGAVEASYADGSGGVITQVLDQTGQVVSAKDGGGLKPSFERNQNLLVTKRTDARGNVTSYEYDAQGNVKSISDSLSGTAPTGSSGNNNSNIFAAGTESQVGSSPTSVAIGDVNGDGKPDMITANLLSNNISILSGNGDGTFGVKTDVAMGSYPASIALGDLDGDGDLDIVTGNFLSFSTSLSILTNNGSGSFTRNDITMPANISAEALELKDLNADGDLDIVISGSGYGSSGQMSVLLGSSGSSFGTRTDYNTENGPHSIAVGRLNQDLSFDVVTANRFSNNVSVFPGNGNGSFGTRKDFPVGSRPESVAVGDLNGDGNSDIITANSSSQNVSVLFGDSNGNFGTPINYSVGNLNPLSVVLGDVDGDSDLDVVVSVSGSANQASVLLNNGTGGLTLKENVALGSQPVATALRDLDLDGDLDLVSVNNQSNNVSIRLNTTLQADGGGNKKRSYTYDPVFNQVASETDELGRKTLYEIDPITGNRRKATKVVGAVGGTDDVVTSYTYTNKNLIDTETDPNGRVTDYDYNPQDQLVKITFAKGTVDEAVQQFEYDAAGNQKAVIDENNRRTEYEYDAMNRLKKTTFAKGTVDEAVQQFEYDGDGNQTAVIDEKGNRSESEYNIMNQLVKVTAPDPDGSGPLTSPVTSYGYDKSGNQVWMLDPLGRRTQYRYDSRNRLSETVNPDGTVEKMRYDSDNNQTANVDAKGNRTNKVYDARGRLIREVDATGKITRFEYDAANQMVAQVDANNNRTEYKYDSLGMRTEVTEGAKTPIASTSKTEYDKVGNVTAEIDANTNKTQYVYDALNRQTKITDPLNNVTTSEYNKGGTLKSVTDPLLRNTSFTYDSLNRQKTVTDPKLNTTTYTYDKAGNQTKITDALNHSLEYNYDALNRKIGSKDALNYTTKSTYDPNSNLLAFTNELGQTTAYTYDTKDRTIAVTDPIGNKVSTEYDINGNVSAITDGLGNTTRYGYDALNRQTTVTDALNKVTTTAYDSVGNVSSLTDPTNNKTTYTYDELNRLKTETNQPLNRTRSYTYDPAGNLIASKDGNNRTRKFVYDKLNRPKEEQWLNSANTPIRTITSSYDAAGQLKTISDPDATYALTYDLAGNLETVDNAGTPNVPNVLLKYNYNQVNRPISVTDTINGQLRGTKSFTYDDANRVTRITQSGNGVSSKRVDMSYDAAGKTKDVTRYNDLNGTGLVASSEYVYDSVGRLTRLSHGKGNVALANYAWTYDFANRVTGFTSPDGSTNYSYDKRDQLTGADYSSGSNESYSYDDNGTRNSSGYQTGSNNKLQSDGVYNYLYDGEGNLTKRTDIVTGEVTEYSWDYRNRLTFVVGKNGSGSVIKSAQYSYDALNRRIVKEVDADGAGSGVSQVERLVYDGQQIALTFDGGGNQTHRYLYGVETDQILADEGAGGSVLWPLTDNLGTVRDLVDSSGVIQNRIGYDSFGKVRSQTNSSVGFRFGFTGRELDSETGLYYNRERYYDPTPGRFISEDPIKLSGGDTNLYRYVYNNPTNLVDPSGLYGRVVNQVRNIQLTNSNMRDIQQVSIYPTAGFTIPRTNITVRSPHQLVFPVSQVTSPLNISPSTSRTEAIDRLNDILRQFRDVDTDPRISMNSGKILNKVTVVNDVTNAKIEYSKTPGVEDNVSPWGDKYERDDNGHIVPRILGGSHDKKYNFFSQNRSINRGEFNSFGKALVEKLDTLQSEHEKCPPGPKPSLDYQVSLVPGNKSIEESRWPLRPTQVNASARFSDGTSITETFSNKIRAVTNRRRNPAYFRTRIR
jgi:RHS repeat-associated protein